MSIIGEENRVLPQKRWVEYLMLTVELRCVNLPESVILEKSERGHISKLDTPEGMR